jgi:hypothetical protein
MKIQRLLCLAGLVAVLLSGGCAVGAATSAEGTFDRVLAVNGPVDLDVRAGAGQIQIRTGPNDSVHVMARIRAGASWSGRDAADRVKQIEAAPPIEQDGGTVRIGDTRSGGIFQNISISYDITVPADTRLRSHSGSGDQAIGNLHGPIDAHAGSGDIQIAQTMGDVQASTGSGRIDLERTDGNLVARTGSGRVHITQIGGGDVDVSTGSGDITVAGASGRLRARAASGDIVVEGRPGQDWDLHTASGSVALQLGEPAAFDLHARTGSGSIETNHPLTALTLGSRRDVQGTAGGGGAKVNVSTASGSIRIR